MRRYHRQSGLVASSIGRSGRLWLSVKSGNPLSERKYQIPGNWHGVGRSNLHEYTGRLAAGSIRIRRIPADRQDDVARGLSAETPCETLHEALPRKRLAQANVSVETSGHAAYRAYG